MVFTGSRGAQPSIKAFTPGTAFGEHSFAWTDFTDVAANEIAAIFIGATDAGTFRIVIDDFALTP